MMAGCMLVLAAGHAQVTTPANQPLNPGDFVGWDNTVTNDPLEIRHNANQPIQWYTNNVHRMVLTPTLVNQNWAWYQQNNLNLSGHLGIGNPVPQRPLTYLHLNSASLTGITVGYRPWMRVGVFSTQGSDGLYAGMRSRSGQTQGVVNWSDDTGADPLSFVFTSTPDNTSVANTLDGLEIARMVAAPNGNEGYMGVGDFFTAGAVPTERFHVLNGRVRVEGLPNDTEHSGAYKVMVVDDAPAPSAERGVVKWRTPSALWATDCRWRMNTGVNNHLSTAFGAADPNCPDAVDAVAIGLDLSGIPAPNGKLTVLTNNRKYGIDVAQVTSTSTGSGINVVVNGPFNTPRGIEVESRKGAVANADNRGVFATAISTGAAGEDFNFGVFGVAQGPVKRSRGVHGESSGATYFGIGGEFISNDDSEYAAGAEGYVTGGQFTADGLWGYSVSNADVSSGVRGLVATPSPSGANKRYNGVMGVSLVTPAATQRACGVYGDAPTVTDSWAIYSNGSQFSTTTGTWSTSDASLKLNIRPVENAMDVLMRMDPKTYAFDTEGFPHLNLATEDQIGFIAQDLEQVIPSMVRDVYIPAELDSAGQVVHASMTIKAVNTEGITPLIVAAMKEQNAVIEELRAQLSELREQVAACCANPDGNRALQQPTGAVEELPGTMPAATDGLLRIVPNPFSEPPTVHYTLERGGRAQLMVHGGDGRGLRVLHEATMEPGNYQLVWDTNALAPGMYYVTLLLDGQPVVEKAVKVAR